jgi:hypothetical protein
MMDLTGPKQADYKRLPLFFLPVSADSIVKKYL